MQDKYKETRTVPQNFAIFFPKTILTQYAYMQGGLKRNSSVQLSKCRGFVTVAYSISRHLHTVLSTFFINKKR